MENFGADGPPGAYQDFDQTECIVLVGHNAAERSTVLWMWILAAKAGRLRPKVIVIDPRRTLTVATGAGLHLQLTPGTNVALLNGTCHLLIDNGWIDRSFIDQHTIKFEQFRGIVARYTLDRVESICGVPSSALRQAAECIGTYSVNRDDVSPGCLSEQSGDGDRVCREQHASADGSRSGGLVARNSSSRVSPGR